MEFPNSLKIDDLQKTHPAYNAVLMARIAMYLRGGVDFDVSNELRKKPIEISSAPEAANIRAAMRSSREGCAFYTNYLRDAIEDLIAEICKDSLQIDDSKERPYWDELDICADGRYSTATTQIRKTMLDQFAYGPAYYCVRFPKPNGVRGDFAAQLKAGDFDAQIIPVCAQAINDWTFEDNGVDLKWARHYETEKTRSPGSNFGPFDYETHRWTYYGKTEIAVFEASRKIGDPWPENAEAKRNEAESQAHELKACPIFCIPSDCPSVGEKLLPTAWQLFNEESDASYYTFVTITGGIFVFTDQPEKAKAITLSPFGAPILPFQSKIERDRCDAQALEALRQASAERRGQLRGLIHEMARQTASQSASGQNTSRASGKAMQKQSDPLNAWLLGFAEQQIGVWRRMIAAIAKIRGEDDEEITVSGLMGSIEDEGEDPVNPDRMQAETQFAQLPNVPAAAKEARGRQLGLEANPQADEKLRGDIQKEPLTPPTIKTATTNDPPITKVGGNPATTQAA